MMGPIVGAGVSAKDFVKNGLKGFAGFLAGAMGLEGLEGLAGDALA